MAKSGRRGSYPSRCLRDILGPWAQRFTPQEIEKMEARLPSAVGEYERNVKIDDITRRALTQLINDGKGMSHELRVKARSIVRSASPREMEDLDKLLTSVDDAWKRSSHNALRMMQTAFEGVMVQEIVMAEQRTMAVFQSQFIASAEALKLLGRIAGSLNVEEDSDG